MASRELNILVAAKGALNAARDIGKVDKATSNLSRTAGRVGKGVAIGLGAGVAIGAAVIGRGIKSGIESLAALENAETQVTGAIAAANQVGKVNAQQISGWANDIEASVQAAFDDKDITSATATLIRFGHVTPSNLRPAMTVMTDLAAKTGSVDSAATALAKAMADPTKAAGVLKRAGVILTKAEQDQIKTLVKHNKLTEAQAFLLDKVGAATKGAAAASVGPYQDSLNILTDVTEDAQKALAVGFLPVITKVRDILTKQLAKPGTLKAIEDFGRGLAGGLDKLIDVALGLPWDSIKSAFSVIGTGSKAMLDAFLGLPPWVQTAVLTAWGTNKLTGGLVSSLASGLIKGVLGMTAGVVNINAGVVNGAGGIPGKGGGLGLIGGIIPAAAILGIGYLIGQGITDAMGGPTAGTPNEGRGRPIGDTGWVFGQHPGALVRQEDERRRNIGNLANRGLGNAQTNAGDLGARGLGNRSAQTALEGQVLQRATAAGFKPSADQITRTANATAARQIAASQSASNAALLTAQATRDGTNRIVAALQALRIPPPTITVSAGDIQSRVVTRNRTVKPHGSRGSVVSGPGASGV